MKQLRYEWTLDDASYVLLMIRVEGTRGHPYSFGEGGEHCEVEVPDFFIATVPVTQAFWSHICESDSNPALNQAPRLPQENISWDQITQPGDDGCIGPRLVLAVVA